MIRRRRHALSLLAHHGRALDSTFIAGSVNTNPTVVRRLVRRLAKAGLVSTHDGARGGTTLARPAARITLAKVYHAVGGEVPLFGTPRAKPDARCRVGSRIRSVLRRCLDRFEAAMERR